MLAMMCRESMRKKDAMKVCCEKSMLGAKKGVMVVESRVEEQWWEAQVK